MGRRPGLAATPAEPVLASEGLATASPAGSKTATNAAIAAIPDRRRMRELRLRFICTASIARSQPRPVPPRRSNASVPRCSLYPVLANQCSLASAR